MEGLGLDPVITLGLLLRRRLTVNRGFVAAVGLGMCRAVVWRFPLLEEVELVPEMESGVKLREGRFDGDHPAFFGVPLDMEAVLVWDWRELVDELWALVRGCALCALCVFLVPPRVARLAPR